MVELAPVADLQRAQAERLLPPTLVLEPGDDAAIMQDEIFGPILVVRSYRDLDHAIEQINGRDRPLALYLFDNDRAVIDKVLDQVVAGGVCINETLLHQVCSDLPFGGVGASGMGHYHGHEGFLTFSKAMPVLRQRCLLVTDRFKPPYGRLAAGILKLVMR